MNNLVKIFLSSFFLVFTHNSLVRALGCDVNNVYDCDYFFVSVIYLFIAILAFLTLTLILLRLIYRLLRKLGVFK
jgi:hypothetical protein